MNAFAHFPARLHWNADQLADAVPLRLHALFPFDAAHDDSSVPAANRESRRTRRTVAYAAPRPLPARFRIR